MNGIILGAGRVGFNLARLMAEQHDITLVDNDLKICKQIDEKIDCYVIYGSGTNTTILDEANIDNADFFVAVTANDEVNFLSSVYANQVGVEKIFARVNNMDHIPVFEKLNLRIINSEISAIRCINRTIIKPTIQTLISLGSGNGEITQLEVKNPEVLNKPLSQIDDSLSGKYLITTIYSKKTDQEFIAKDDSILEYGDSIVLLVKSENLDEVTKLFTKD